MGRCSVATVLVFLVAGSSYGSEPKLEQSTRKAAPHIQQSNFQRILARLAERDRATTIDVAMLLTRPQPDLALFMFNRLTNHERATDIRADVFNGPKLQLRPLQSILDRVAEFVVRPTAPIARYLESQLPTIPLLQRIESKLEREAKLRRDVLYNLTLFTSPQPQFGKYLQRLNESEDLRQAANEMQRFWMNNQPSVLRYERLNGAIGP